MKCILILSLFCFTVIFAQTVVDKEAKNDKETPTQKQAVDGTKNQFFGLWYYLPRGECVYDSSGGDEKIIYSRLRFRMINETNNSIRLCIRTIYSDPDNLLYAKDSLGKILRNKKNPKYDKYVNMTNTDKDYYLFKDANHAYTYHYKALTSGILILPIKIRFAVDSFPVQASPDVSVGPYFGYQWGTKAFASRKEQTLSHTLALFAAPGIISLNSSNSRDSSQKNSTNFGISFGGGYLFELNNFQIGFFAGYDFIFGEPSKSWIYQPFENNKAPWISIAIGFNFRKDT